MNHLLRLFQFTYYNPVWSNTGDHLLIFTIDIIVGSECFGDKHIGDWWKMSQFICGWIFLFCIPKSLAFCVDRMTMSSLGWSVSKMIFGIFRRFLSFEFVHSLPLYIPARLILSTFSSHRIFKQMWLLSLILLWWNASKYLGVYYRFKIACRVRDFSIGSKHPEGVWSRFRK